MTMSMFALFRQRFRTPGMFMFSPSDVPLIRDGVHYTQDANYKVSDVCLPSYIHFSWYCCYCCAKLPLLVCSA